MWLSLFNWWAFSLATFWFAACLCIWPWQATQHTEFDLKKPRRKFFLSAAIAAFQAVVFWIFITVSSRGGILLLDLVLLAIVINYTFPKVIRFATPRTEDEWEELVWISNGQFGLWLLAGVVALLVR